MESALLIVHYKEVILFMETIFVSREPLLGGLI